MIKYILTGLLFIFTNSYSQYSQQWANRLNGSANRFDIANNLFLDAQSNAYVYSTISNTDNMTDICAIKYNAEGNIVWQYVYSSPGIDQLQDVYKDASNNSYLTGYTQDSGQIKLLTVKLSTQGDSVWTRITSVAGYENLISHSITLDNSGNVFVLLDGKNSSTSRTDFIIVKYNSAGNLVLKRVFEGSTEGDDFGVKILVNSSGNVFAAVNSKYNILGTDMCIYRFDNNLNQTHLKKYNGGANSDDGGVDLKFSNDSNLILTGKFTNAGTSADIATFKLNSGNVDIIWARIYNGAGNDIDLPYALTFDTGNNILVTGYSRSSNVIGSEDIISLKYSPEGNLLWSRIYNDSVNGIDQGYSICADAENNVYVGGAADNGSGHLGYIALKYDSEGNLLWKGNYHYYHLSEDFVYKIAVNSNQDIFVTGMSFSPGTDYDVATIKYARQTGINSNYEIINDFKLYSNYPNPFNPSTIIRFYNPERNFISIKVFDLNGREVALLENKILAEGNYEYEFKAENLSSGVYIYRVNYGDNFKSGKMIFNK